MTLENLNIGFALTGSFCTLKRTMEALKELSKMSGIKLPTLNQRINISNWGIEKAVETAVKYKVNL